MLRGEALQNADDWARGKRLSDADEKFLRERREVERIENERLLVTEREARQAAEHTNKLKLEKEKIEGALKLGRCTYS